MRNLMKEAHKLTREIVNKYGDVDYKTQLGLCLSFLAQEGGNEMEEEITKAESKLLAAGFKTWEVGCKNSNDYKRRIYINNIAECMNKFGITMGNPSFYRGKRMYYDCVDGKFYFTFKLEGAKKIDELIALLRA